MSPYRGAEVVTLSCPRCRKHKLPPLDVATCPSCAGIWVSAFAASEVLTEQDRRANPVKKWWRVREPCPSCGEKMDLFGMEPGLLQGCAVHGFFIDADTVGSTGLARGVDHEALERKHQDRMRIDAEREEREIAAREKATARADKAQRGRALDQEITAMMEDDDALFEALRGPLGDIAAAVIVKRLRSLEELARRS